MSLHPVTATVKGFFNTFSARWKKQFWPAWPILACRLYALYNSALDARFWHRTCAQNQNVVSSADCGQSIRFWHATCYTLHNLHSMVDCGIGCTIVERSLQQKGTRSARWRDRPAVTPALTFPFFFNQASLDQSGESEVCCCCCCCCCCCWQQPLRLTFHSSRWDCGLKEIAIGIELEVALDCSGLQTFFQFSHKPLSLPIDRIV